MPMNPRLLRPLASGVHPEANAWRTAVVANGGSVSASTMRAVSKFCADIDAAGIRDRFYRLNLFAGTGLNACLVPLYRGQSRTGTQYGNATDTNNGPFVSGDYSESSGLTGNGTNQYLNTGFNVDQLPGAADCHLSSYIRGTQDIAATRTLVGTMFNGFSDIYRLILTTSGAGTYRLYGELGKAVAVSNTSRPNANGGLMLISRTSTTSLRLYDDGAFLTQNTGSTAELTSAVPIFVFARNGPAEYYNGTMAGYSIGGGMSNAEVTSFYNVMNTFQTALGRAQA